MKAILAIDQGTTASKAALFSPSGRALGLARVPVRTSHGPDGRVEQDPLHLIATQKLAIQRALAIAGHPRVIAAGIASQRSTFVIWERDSGRPVAAAPTWQDTSASGICARLQPSGRRIRRLTGLPLSPHYSATKIAALMRSLEGLRQRARRGEVLFGSVATYVLWRLSRGRVHAIDPTLAARTLLMSIDTLCWEPSLLELFGVPRAILPEVRPSLGDFGSIRIDGAEVPVRACLGDQQAALAGATGLSFAGGAAPLVNYGTGAFALMPTGDAPLRRDGLLTSLAWSSGSRRAYLLEGTANAAGAALDWLRREMNAPERLDQIDRLCRRAPGRAHLLPAFWGLGSVYSSGRDRALPSIVLNLGPRDTLSDLTRGAVEAIAHVVAVILERAKGASARRRRLVATGGLARLRYLLEFQAALLPGTELVVSRRSEATLAGVARAVASGLPECEGRTGAWTVPASRPVVASRELRRLAAGRHEEWHRLIALGRTWRKGEEEDA